MPSPILQSIGLKKDFRGFTAVDGVDLSVAEGSIHALIGPNGAGKTTFFNLLTKFLQPSAGRILFAGEDVTHLTPAMLARKGLVRSFQISAVFPHMSALENVRLALQRQLGLEYAFWRPRRVLTRLNDQALHFLGEVGLDGNADVKAADLPYGSKRALELATTLASDPKVLLLDEPTQGMAHEELARIIELVRRAARRRTVLMVEHNMRIVSELASQISVLQRGTLIASGSYAEVSRNAQVIQAYMGKGAGGLGAPAAA
jgi:branched-chain amino acid transport system ATP-binding protein